MDRSGSKASTGGPWGRLAQPEDPEGGRLVYHQPSEGWISIGFIHKTSFSRSAFIKVFAIDQIQSTSISKQIKLDKQLNSRISGLICTNIRPYIGSYGTLLALYHAYRALNSASQSAFYKILIANFKPSMRNFLQKGRQKTEIYDKLGPIQA